MANRTPIYVRIAEEIRKEVDARDVALTLVGLQNGLLTLWLMDRQLFSLKDRAVSMAELFLRGISVQQS